MRCAQELLDTIVLLKSALERTKKGLESGVSNSKYMEAVDKAKQLKAQVELGSVWWCWWRRRSS